MGGTIYDSTFDHNPIHIRLLEEMGVIEPDSMTHDEFEEILESEPTDWFVAYALDNKVGPHWEPTTEFWVEYDKQILTRLGMKNNLNEMAVEFEKKWQEALSSPECRSCYIESSTPIFEELKAQGYLLGIASNRFSNPEPRLQEDGIRHFFDVVEYTATPGYAKPNPYMLIKAASALGINPLRCAYVGNKVKFDVEASRRAEMLPIIVTWCNPDEVKLADNDTIIIEDMKYILDSISM